MLEELMAPDGEVSITRGRKAWQQEAERSHTPTTRGKQREQESGVKLQALRDGRPPARLPLP